MKFFMVRHYIYNGEGRHDDDVVIPFPTRVQAVMYVERMNRSPYYTEYSFEYNFEGDEIFIQRGPGQYAYDYYYIQQMTMGEEI